MYLIDRSDRSQHAGIIGKSNVLVQESSVSSTDISSATRKNTNIYDTTRLD